MRYFRCLLMGLLVFLARPSNAEYFRTLGIADGLIHYAVHDIYQDSIGRMWFGTPEGISIYDGYKMESYRMYDFLGKYPPIEKQVKQFGTDGSNMVYMNAAGNFVGYNCSTETFSILSDMQVEALSYTGNEVYAVNDSTLMVWNASEQRFANHIHLPFNAVRYFIRVAEQEWWFATRDGLYCYDGRTFHHILPHLDIRHLLHATDGALWVSGLNNGIFKVNMADRSFVNYSVKNSLNKGFTCDRVRCIAEDKSGNMWIGTLYGLFKYNTDEDVFHLHSWSDIKGGLGHASVYSVYVDHEGNLWAGTYRGGVSYYRPSRDRYTYYGTSSHKNGLSHPVIGSILEDKHSNIWICTKGGGLNMLSRKTGEIRKFLSNRYPYFLPHTNLTSAYYDEEKDYLYLGSNAGIFFIYDIPHNRFVYKGDRKYIVNSMIRRGDNLFLSTNKGIYAMDVNTNKDQLVYTYNMIHGAFIVDQKDCLWISTDKYIYRYNAETLMPIDSTKISNLGIDSNIFYMYSNKAGDIYACTHGGGLYKFNNVRSRFENYPKLNSDFLGADCFKIVERNDGSLVVTSSKGIVSIDTKTEKMNLLQSWKMMPIEAFSGICGLFVAADSTVFVGGMNGMMAISPMQKKEEHPSNNIYFSELYVDGRMIHPNDSTNILQSILPMTDEIELNYMQNKIDIRFALTNPVESLDEYLCEYRLAKEDEKWYKATGNIISYSNLTPGKYDIELRAIKNGDEDNVYSKGISIVILPPWYSTSWAWCLWLFMGVSVLVTIVWVLLKQEKLYALVIRQKAEKEQLEALNDVKLTFFTSVSHEFRTPLTLIIGQLESVLHNFNLPPMAHNKLTKAIKQTALLNNLISELIDFRKYEKNKMRLKVSEVLVNLFIEKAVSDFRDQANLLNLRLEVTPCADDVKAWFDEKEMLRVFYNLLSNAMKYTMGGGLVSVVASTDEHHLYIRIIDNGIGMTQEELNKIFTLFYTAGHNANCEFKDSSGIGLSMVKIIIDMHGGKIKVESEKDKGSIFTIVLPLDKEHYAALENVDFLAPGNEANDGLVSALYVKSDSEEADPDMQLTEGDKPKVVIVEDNKELLEVLSDIFQVQYDVSVASDGKQGLSLIESIKPDLVVSDVMMPGIDGKELCRKVKNNIELCHIPFVMLTALNNDNSSMEGLLSGADDYIGKPFNSRLLLVRCNNIIKSRRLLRKKFEKDTDMNVNVLATNRIDKEFLDKVKVVLEENLDRSDFDIDVFASIVGMSRTSFYNKFKKIVGQTPNDFIMTFRLNKSVQLMKEYPEYTVSEIADKLGFNTPNYFCKRFKDHFGKTPTQFKNAE